MDTETLEKSINEWKVIAGEFKNDADKYCRDINKIFRSSGGGTIDAILYPALTPG